MRIKRTRNAPLRKCAVAQDISGLGRCSLGAALPVLAALGVEGCAIPTGVYTNQTGYPSFAKMDCTALLPDFPTQWTHADVRTEGFLTGFLSDVTQADILRKDVIPQILCKDGILLVDPVLGDDGARYPFVGDDLAVGMRRLASMADILTPNVTELRILAGENNFSQPDFSQAKLLDFLAERVRGIEKKPGAAVVVTGVPAGADILTCIFCADAPQKVLRRKRLPGSYSGTGDLLAALLMGYSLQDRPLSDAVRGAVKFLSRCISDAAARGLPGQGGIPFEQHLRRLL